MTPFQEKIFDKDKVHGMNPAKFDGVEDCAELGYLSEASVLHNLKLRYDANIIYVRSATSAVLSCPIYPPGFADEADSV